MASSLVCPTEVAAAVTHRPLTLESIYREHFRLVWRLLRRLGVAEAQLDDAAQDVFLVVQRKLGDFDARAPVRSWIFAIGTRVASEYRRRVVRARSVPLDEGIADASANPARQTEMQEAVRLLHALLSELDEDKRTVFVLSELEQLSVVEIASVLGQNVNTIYSRLRSARKSFDRALARRLAATRAGARK